jgi:hypothetical protein
VHQVSLPSILASVESTQGHALILIFSMPLTVGPAHRLFIEDQAEEAVDPEMFTRCMLVPRNQIAALKRCLLPDASLSKLDKHLIQESTRYSSRI